MLVYIEFISRRPGVSLEAFRAVTGLGQTGWAGGYGEDQMIVNLGRTWRLGPEPEYMTVWYTPDHGIDRLTEWERVFSSGEASHFEEPFRLAARIDRGGCYEPLREPVAAGKGRFYVEYLDFAAGASREDVTTFFEDRSGTHGDLELNLLADRIGKLAPDPRALAIWRIPDYAALDAVARDLDGNDGPVRLVTAGLYAHTGEETL